MFGILLAYKYLDFFGNLLLGLLGREQSFAAGLLLPVGISFYTFSAAGYLFDVLRGKCEAEKNVLTYAVFFSFFPSILSGPINRAGKLLPQIKAPGRFSYEAWKHGLLRLAVGAVKKVVLADTIGIFVNAVYDDLSGCSAVVVLLAVLAYSFQIYFDFSGYSDMAIGAAEMLGFRLEENFHFPYLARDVKEFWKRWHISLTSWFREYLYFPLGGSRKGVARTYLNVLIVFAVSGLWHGSAWNFIIWGLLNGLYQVIGQLLSPAKKRLHGRLNVSAETGWFSAVRVLSTFLLIAATWVFFRAGSVTQALLVFRRILSVFREGLALGDVFSLISIQQIALSAIILLLFFFWELRREKGKPAFCLEKRSFSYWLTLCLIALVVGIFGVYGDGFDPQDFVYFKF